MSISPTAELEVSGRIMSRDLVVTGTGGMSIGGGTTAQRAEYPALGTIRYNSTTGFMEGYAAAGWAPIAQPPTVTGISPLSTLTSGGALPGWEAGTKIQASDIQAGDYFGYSVSMSSDGTKVIVGAYSEDTGGSSAGKVYIYTYSSGSWGSEVMLQASDKTAGDNFGRSVSMNSDGTKVIVGASHEETGGTNAGAAYIFALSGGSWSQQAKIMASDIQATDNFGWSVSMNSDGTKVIIGAWLEDTGGSDAGATYIFAYSSGSWSQEAKLLAATGGPEVSDYFGYSVAMNSDGTKVIMGAYNEDTGSANAGAAYIFALSGGSWSQEAKIQASDAQGADEFGISVSMNSDGTKVLVGAYNEDTGATNAGAAYIFALSGGSWSQEAKIQASDPEANDRFGISVSMNSDGTKVIVGAQLEDTGGTDAGAAYIFEYDPNQIFDSSTQVFTATGTGIVSGSTVQLEGADGTLYSVFDATAPNAAGTQITFKMLKDNLMTPSEYDAVNTNSYSIYFEPNPPSVGQASGNYGNFLYNSSGDSSGSHVQWSSHLPYVALAMAQMGSFGGGTPPNCPATQLWIDKDINGSNTYKIVGIKSGPAIKAATIAQQPYKVKVNSTSGLTGTSTAAIGFAVGWTTAAGANLEFNTNATTTQTLAGTDGGGGTNRTFSVAPGSNALPSPLVLTGSTGAITGTIAAVGTTSVTFRLTDNASGAFTDRAINIVGVDALYSFSPNPFTFTNAGQTGRLGPTLATLTGHADYSSAAWRTNTAYFKLGAPSPSPTTYPLRLNGFQLWTVPLNATYKIIAKGARGGSSTGTEDGYGGQIEARFTLTRGTKIIIVVGQEGATPGSSSGGGGGGGATFILKDNFSVSSSNPYMGSDLSDIYMIVGGGGGGTSDAHSSSGRAGDAEMYSSGGAIGGTNAASYGGGGGTGYTTTGSGYSSGGKASGGGILLTTTQFYGFPGGESWTSGSYGLQDGGFGGGGAAVHHEGAAGGGYQGGSCGTFQSTNPDAGGHTFVSSTATYTGSHTTHTDQHGSVQITKM